MGVCVTCKSAVKDAQGRILVIFSDGSQSEYASLADARNATFDLDTDPEHAKKWAIAKWLKADPAAIDPATYINGKTCTLDVGAYQEVSFV
jgi:hypothetical protein